jgi:hypothetical protein
VEKSQSGGPTKSGGGGRPTLPDSGGKVIKRKKVFPFNNLASLNPDFAKKKNAKKGKKRQKTNYGSHPVFGGPRSPKTFEVLGDPKVIHENFAMLLGLSKLGNAAGVV